MISPLTVTRALYGCWRLALFDKSGLQYFDQTERGFWQSFFAVALIFPSFLFFEVLGTTNRGGSINIGAAVVAMPAAYIIMWVGVALLVFHIAELTDRFDRYFAAMVPFHWSAVIQATVILAYLLLANANIIPLQLLSSVSPLLDIWIMIYAGYILYVGFGGGIFLAAGIVVMDVILSEVVMVLMRSMIIS